MSDLQDLIARNAVMAYNQGVERGATEERDRIVHLLEPLAEHSELCELGCYPEDCSAGSYQYAIQLIKGELK